MRPASRALQFRRPGLQFDALETRVVPAGNVAATLAATVLTLTGDDAANVVTVAVHANEVILTPDEGTSINSQPQGQPVSLIGGVSFLKAALRGGADELIADHTADFTLARGAAIDLGDGDNSLDLSTGGKFDLGSLAVKAADGRDTVELAGGPSSQIRGPASIVLGDGGSNLTLTGLDIHGPGGLRVLTGEAADFITLTNVGGGRPVNVRSGNAFGRINVDGGTLGDVTLTGADVALFVDGAASARNVTVTGAQGSAVTAEGNSTVTGSLVARSTMPGSRVAVDLRTTAVGGRVIVRDAAAFGNVTASLTDTAINGPISVLPAGANSTADVLVTGGSLVQKGLTAASGSANTHLNIEVRQSAVRSAIRATSTGPGDAGATLLLDGGVSAASVTVVASGTAILNAGNGPNTIAGTVLVTGRGTAARIGIVDGQLAASAATVSSQSKASLLLDGASASLALAGNLTLTTPGQADVSINGGLLALAGTLRLQGATESAFTSRAASHFGRDFLIGGGDVRMDVGGPGSLAVDGDLRATARQAAQVNLNPGAATELRGSAVIRGGAGNDLFTANEQVRFHGALAIDHQAGTGTVQISGTPGTPTVGGDLTILTGAGSDSFSLLDVSVSGAARFSTGGGSDRLSIERECAFAAPVWADLGSGDDAIAVADVTNSTAPVTFAAPVRIDAGTGNDTLQLGQTGATGSKVVFRCAGNTITCGPGLNVVNDAEQQVELQPPATLDLQGWTKLSNLQTFYYVSPAGDDGNTGSSGSPWRTLQKAADAVTAGGTVIVRAGHYAGFNIASSGASTARITFKADPGAVIDAPLNFGGADYGINGSGKEYITIDGFKFAPQDGQPEWYAAIRLGGLPGDWVRGNIVRNNVAEMRVVNVAATPDKYGIYSSWNDGLLVENNTVSGTYNSLIYTANSARNYTIRGNTGFNGGGNGIHNNGDLNTGAPGINYNALIEGNTIYNVGFGIGGQAISCDGVQDSRIQNNLLYDLHAKGISLYNTNGAEGSKRNVIANNTVLVAADGQVALRLNHNASDNIVFNNIFYAATPDGAWTDSEESGLEGSKIDFNVTTGIAKVGGVIRIDWHSTYGFDLDSIVGNPTELFVNAGADDFHLAAGSPAVNAGTAAFQGAAAPIKDIFGNDRPAGGAFDIGAVERVG
jgi:hypothetical protein